MFSFFTSLSFVSERDQDGVCILTGGGAGVQPRRFLPEERERRHYGPLRPGYRGAEGHC